MQPTDPNYNPNQEYGLIIQDSGKPQQILVKFVILILNFQYGLQIMRAQSPMQGASLLNTYSQGLRCVFLVQRQKPASRTSLTMLDKGDTLLFVLVPATLLGLYTRLCEGFKYASICAWERAFSKQGPSVRETLKTTFAEHGIGNLLGDGTPVPYEELRVRVEQRLKNLNTLPTLPEIVLRIMRLTRDPNSRVKDLENVLMSDPAIVHKLIQIVNAPTFAGAGHKGKWTLQQAIVRLGLNKVGAIAQQIKLMNSFIKPEDSHFDLRRFWEHSVACATIADRLYTGKHLSLKTQVDFNDYWIGAIMHDIGKLVLGFFFWDHFESVIGQAVKEQSSFLQAEHVLGDTIDHQYVGQLLALKSNLGSELTECIQSHDDPGTSPNALTCLLHIANNLGKDWGLGYLPEEQGVYSPSALQALGLTEEGVREIKESIGDTIVFEIKELVQRCLSPA